MRKHHLMNEGPSRAVYSLIGSLIFFGVTTSSPGRAADLDGWLQTQTTTSWQKLMANVSPPGTAKGVVVASPSQSLPDYFYYWVRDAALTMNVVVRHYAQAIQSYGASSSVTQADEQTLTNYINFSLQNQHTPNPSGGPGEPKFNVDGSAYLGQWGRPQNDGPALRALTFIRLANDWLALGRESDVRSKLYSSDDNSLIKFDLEYVSHQWQNTCFDLWEEVNGHHFYTEMVQRRAMIEGAQLAQRLGDSGAATWYSSQAKAIEDLINRHWDANNGIIQVTLDQTVSRLAAQKTSGLDSSVILAVLHGDTSDGFFAPSDEKVLSTAQHIEEAFTNLYHINQGGNPGIAIGRYPEDTYDGYNAAGVGNGVGNAWFLLTNGFGEYYYKVAQEFSVSQQASVSQVSLKFFQNLGLNVQAGKTFSGSELSDLISKLRAKGDQFLSVTQLHSDNGAMSEQMNRDSGDMQGAPDLTWSYASLLTSIQARSSF